MEILLAMQAAGMVTDWLAARDQIKMGRLGARMEQAGIESNIAMTRLQSEDASLQAMRKLRQTLATQTAISAARGAKTGAGTAFSLTTESISNFNDDARARRMNLLAKEANLRAAGVLSGLHQLESETQIGRSMTNRFMNNTPTSSMGGFSNTSSGGNFGFTPA